MRIDSLTSLRFFAAAAVLVHHMEFLRTSPNSDVRAVFDWMFEGFFGVQFFYVLSGFVIAYSFASRAGTLSFGDFMFFRAARLFPIHWLTLIVATYLYGSLILSDPGSWLRFIANATLIQSFIAHQSFYFNFNAVSWSISTEMFFYAAFCLFVPLRTRAILLIWTALLSVIIINIIVADMGSIFTNWLLYINPVFRFIDFLTGVLLYRIFVIRPLKLSYRLATLAEVASIALVVASVAVAIVWAVPIQWRWDIYYVPSTAIVVFVFAHQRGMISNILNNRFLVLLGDASFALYMTHQMIIYLSPWTARPETILRLRDMAQAAVLLLAIGTFISIILHLGFEKPVNDRLRRWWTSSRTRSFIRSNRLLMTDRAS